uniref:Tyrosine-protein phosphatase domain-containing protein n=1 Tax=Parastrongyloides trichosuri TaxID=131310 RepID=A0A0N4ZAJ3_PARTI
MSQKNRGQSKNVPLAQSPGDYYENLNTPTVVQSVIPAPAPVVQPRTVQPAPFVHPNIVPPAESVIHNMDNVQHQTVVKGPVKKIPSSKRKAKNSDKEKKKDDDDENELLEESPQLGVPSEALVDFFLANHDVDKKEHYKEFCSILEYTRLVYNFMSNPTKNRFNNVLCFNEGSVKLKVTRPEEGEYIHASRFVTKDGGYIMTQAPLPNTLEDFWRMVWQEDAKTIVSFADFANLDECTEYFNLKKGKKKSIGKFNIKTVDIENLSGYLGYFLKVNCKDDPEPRMVTVVSWLNWNVDQMVDIAALVDFMQIVWNLERSGGREMRFSSKNMTVVHGTSGTRRTGTFVVLSLLCKQLFLKKKCNLISTAVLVRKYRHNVLRDKNMFAVLLLAMIKFSVANKLLRKDRKHIEKVEHIIKNALVTAVPVAGKR